jgi:S1-C subfamily serine protease
MRRGVAFCGWVFAFWVAVILVADEKAIPSPISLNWVHATVRVENEWSKGGTGFLVIRKMKEREGKVFLVTNKHVIHADPQRRKEALFLTLYLNVWGEDGRISGASFRTPLIEGGQRLWREHPDPNVDVFVVDVTDLVNRNPRIENKGADYSLFGFPDVLKKENITEGDEVFIIGYPLGLFHSRINSPLVRQGIIATKIGERIQIRMRLPSGDSKPMEIPGFLVDAAIVPGSSGSPVVLKPIIGRKVGEKIAMEMAEPYLLGIVSASETATLRVEDRMFPAFAGLGIVFDVSAIKETIELFFP